jgi:hypothetical protein
MRPPRRFPSDYGFIAGMVIMLAACQPAAVAGPSTQSAASPSAPEAVLPTASPSLPASPSPAPADPTPTAASSTPFACEPLDIRQEADLTHALIADVRVGTHSGYDRVVFEFAQAPDAPPGIPEYVLQNAEPPLAQDPSGMPMEVAGDRYVQLALLGGTKYDEDYNLTYGGPTEFDPGFPALAALHEAGDFEATATWYLGLNQQPCLRVFTLSGPHRLVIDIAH